jgi:5-methylcytosine-specific restriction endonuclease McrA
MTPTLEQRGKKLASSRKWYQTERQQILLRLGGKCSKCGSTENLDVRDSHAARGGMSRVREWRESDAPEKLALLCRSCHEAL